jgi:hypothetical protein
MNNRRPLSALIASSPAAACQYHQYPKNIQENVYEIEIQRQCGLNVIVGTVAPFDIRYIVEHKARKYRHAD